MANKDGVLSIGIEYKAELNKMIADLEGGLDTISKNNQLSKGMKQQFDNVIAEVRNFKATMEKELATLGSGKVDKTAFKSFKQTVANNFKTVREDIDRLDLAVSTLNSQMEIISKGVDLSKITKEFAGFEDYVNRTNEAVSQLIDTLGQQGISLFSFDNRNISDTKNKIKEIDNIINQLDTDKGVKFELFDEKEAQSELDRLSVKLRSTLELMEHTEKQISNMDNSTVGFKKMQSDFALLQLKAASLNDTIEMLYTVTEDKGISIEMDDKSFELYDKYTEDLSDNLESIIASAKNAKKELSTLLESQKQPTVKVSSEMNPNSSELATTVTIETTSSELWKKLSPILTDLQGILNSNPVVAPVKLVVAPNAVSSTENGDVGKVSSAYSKKYAKVLAETGEDTVIDLEGVYKKTFTSIMDTGVSYAKETIGKIQDIFDKSPINIKYDVSQEEIDKIQNFVLSNKDGKKIDISGQITKAKQEVEDLNINIEKTSTLLQETKSKGNVEFDGFDKFTDDLSKSIGKLEELQNILKALQNIEITLAKASGLSSITEIENQWESLEKRIINATKLDGSFRKNASINKIASEYQKYIDMGGTNALSNISKIQENKDTINAIISKAKEFQKQDFTNDSVEKLSVDLDGVIDKFNELINTVKTATNALYKIIRDGNVSGLDKQWSSISNKFKSIADESGKINLSKQKTDIKELMEMYQKYLNAGGMKSTFDLTDNTETLTKLNKVYSQINNRKLDTSVVSKEKGEFGKVEKSVDSLTDSINTKTDAIKTEANTVELAARAEVKSIGKIIESVNQLIERIKSISDIKPKINISDTIQSDKSNISSASDIQNIESKTDAIQNQSKAYREWSDAIKYGIDRMQKAKELHDAGLLPYDVNNGGTQRINRDKLVANKIVTNNALEKGGSWSDFSNASEEYIKAVLNKLGMTSEQFHAQLKAINTIETTDYWKNISSGGWIRYGTSNESNVEKATKELNYKIYAAFEDAINLTKENISDILNRLQKEGFVGQLKTNPSVDTIGETDQIVIHGRNEIDQKIAYNVLKAYAEETGKNFSFLDGGFDQRKPSSKSFSTLLSGGLVNIDEYKEKLQETRIEAEKTSDALDKINNPDTSKTPIKDVFHGDKIDQATTSAKELDKTLEQVDIPTDSFDEVLSKLDLTKSELKEIVKITKQSVSDSKGKFHDSYTLKDKHGSTEIYGLNSNTEKGQLLRSNIIGYNTKEIEQETKAVQKLAEEESKLLQQERQLSHSYWQGRFKDSVADITKTNDELVKMNKYYSELEKMSEKVVSAQNKVDNANIDIDNLTKREKQTPDYVKAVKNYRIAINELQNCINRLNDNGIKSQDDINELNRLQGAVDETSKSIKNMPAYEKGTSSAKSSTVFLKIEELRDKYKGMSKDMQRELDRLERKFAGLGDRIDTGRAIGELKQFETQLIKTGTATNSLWSAMKDKAFYNFANQLGTMVSFYDLINVARQAGQAVIDLNTNITELAKVSEATSSQIYDDFNSYADIAKEVGGTISDTISATADWSRNGYNIPDAKELAEVAMIYKNVGDGIDIDQANEYLISTLRGFSLEAKDAMDIIDSINEVANNEPISSAGIGEALQRSAAAFNVANTSLQESIALVTSTNSVLQSPEKVGSMWTTVSARIRGAKTELEDAGLETDGMVESTSKLQSLIKGMTGFDILEDDQKTFKSIYDIIIGIGEEFQNLSGVDQAALLEALAGKRQSNALAATLNNVDLLKKAYGEATNAEGSAMAEQEKYQQSIQYSIDRTKASLEELANDFISSDFLKGLIDSGDKLINILDLLIDKFGILGTTAIVGVGILGGKNLGKVYKRTFSYCFEYALYA